MMRLLQISGLGIIDNLEIEWSDGLNVITGETGAGKSLVAGALDVLLGSRMSADMIRSGDAKASVRAVFAMQSLPGLTEKLIEFGLSAEEELHLSREISREGKGTCRVNGALTPLTVYREISEGLMDIHGQHDTQSLLRQATHLDMLDAWAGESVAAQAGAVAEIHHRRREVSGRLVSLTQAADERARRMDYLSFQIKEIDEAGLTAQEKEELESERLLLANAERLHELSSAAYQELYEREGTSSLESVDRALRSLQAIEAIDRGWEAAAGRLQSVLAETEDIARALADYRARVEYDPQRADYVEERLHQIGRLCTKYGGDIEAVLDYGRQAMVEMEDLARQETDSQALESDLKTLTEELMEMAGQLSRLRRQAAARMSEEVMKELSGLGLASHIFSVCVEDDARGDADKIGPRGMDQVEMMVSLNPGEPLLPLRRVASGGELSRLALALKTVLAGRDLIPSIVFDEIDAGVGSRLGEVIADRMRTIALHHQVICITHTPHIAAAAHNHLLLSKSTEGERATVTVISLNGQERAQELAAMMGAAAEQEAAMSVAAAMVERYS